MSTPGSTERDTIPRSRRDGRILLALGFAYGLFLSWGLPLWDDDYTSWLRPAMAKSWLGILGEILSPISTQAGTWGFNERPMELLYYKVGYAVSGYSGWCYWTMKCLALGVMVHAFHRWALELTPASRWGRSIAAAGSLFLLLAPCTAAAFGWLADFEPVASAWFLLCSYGLWRLMEDDDDSVKKWLILIGLIYLGYKAKATLKILPAMVIIHAALIRRPKFIVPGFLMALLALPWSTRIFAPPPFLRPEGAGLPGWMWQFPSLHRLEAFFWNSEVSSLSQWLGSPTLSLGGMLGPLLLCPLVLAAGSPPEERRRRRAVLFIGLWLLLAIPAVSVLPELNYAFRVRYGLILMVPVGLLLTWILGRLETVHRGVAAAFAGLLLVQSTVNLHRSLVHRADLGAVIAACDLAYSYVATQDPNGRLLHKDVLLYDWHPDAPPVITGRSSIADWNDISGKEGAAILSWEKPPANLQPIATFSGQSPSRPFDRLYPWPIDRTLYLSRIPKPAG